VKITKRLAAFLRPQRATARVDVVAGTRVDDYVRWLSDFDRDTVEGIVAAMTEAPESTALVRTSGAFDRFTNASRPCVRAVADTFASLIHGTAPIDRIVWSGEALDGRGLPDIELKALFGLWLDLEAIARAPVTASREKVVVIGRLREQRVGATFRIDAGSRSRLTTSLLSIDLMNADPFARVPIASLFVSASDADRLVRLPHRTKRSLLDLLERGARLALLVPREETNPAPGDVAWALERLRTLGDGATISHGRFTAAERLPPAPHVWAEFASAGVRIDSSFSWPHEPAPYCGADPFWPQPFDWKTPAGVSHPDVPLEAPLVPLRGLSMRALAECRIGYDEDRLAPLFDYQRWEQYHLHLEPRVEYSQQYHRYRVYSCPIRSQSPHALLLDGGSLANPLRVAAVLTQLNAIRSAAGRTWRVVDYEEWERTARSQANRAFARNHRDVLRAQVIAHDYLAVESPAAPLRADHAAFAAFVPCRLGRTLELGSGFGQLARVLAPRASSYVCVDLIIPALVSVRCAGFPAAVCDMHRLTFADRSFDTVIANNVLEHAYDPVAALKEIRRVLRPDGRLLALIPLDALNANYQLPAHYWKASEQNIEAAAAMAGLDVLKRERIDLTALGVRGSFPSCNGISLAIELSRRSDS